MDNSYPLYTVQLDVSNYHLMVFQDLLRMFTLQVVVQLLFYMRHGDVEFLSTYFVENIIFLLLGLLVYWYVVNQVFRVTNEKLGKEHLNYYQSILI